MTNCPRALSSFITISSESSKYIMAAVQAELTEVVHSLTESQIAAEARAGKR